MTPITNALTKTTGAFEGLGPEGSFLESPPEGVKVCDKSKESVALVSKSRIFSETKKMMKDDHFCKRIPSKFARDDTMKLNDTEYDLTPQMQKSLTTKNYVFRIMNGDALLPIKIFSKIFNMTSKKIHR